MSIFLSLNVQNTLEKRCDPDIKRHKIAPEWVKNDIGVWTKGSFLTQIFAYGKYFTK